MNFGDKITINSKLVRRSKYGDEKLHINEMTECKYWKTVQLEKPTDVVVIGQRTLSNGDNCYENEIGYIYSAREYFKALLVVKDMHTNPFYIKA